MAPPGLRFGSGRRRPSTVVAPELTAPKLEQALGAFPAVWKTVGRASASWVRIPPPPLPVRLSTVPSIGALRPSGQKIAAAPLPPGSNRPRGRDVRHPSRGPDRNSVRPSPEVRFTSSVSGVQPVETISHIILTHGWLEIECPVRLRREAPDAEAFGERGAGSVPIPFQPQLPKKDREGGAAGLPVGGGKSRLRSMLARRAAGTLADFAPEGNRESPSRGRPVTTSGSALGVAIARPRTPATRCGSNHRSRRVIGSESQSFALRHDHDRSPEQPEVVANELPGARAATELDVRHVELCVSR